MAVRHVIVIGSGPAAAGATLAIAAHRDVRITVVDVGGELEADRERARLRLRALSPADWAPGDVDRVRRQPVAQGGSPLPQKRAFGSDYPFRDFGQLDGVVARGGANASVVSGAYGGFSTVWGAQVMPYPAASFEAWPVSSADMEPHYRAVLSAIPFAGVADDLAELFPLLGEPAPLPPPAPRTAAVLAAYERSRDRVRRAGVTVGQARLALDAARCARCGLCMTGCPYGLVYSADQTFDALRRSGRVDYHGGLVAYRVGEDGAAATVDVRDRRTGERRRLRADRLFVACGSMGTTRLVLGSVSAAERTVTMAESVQFMVPMGSLAPTPDPRGATEMTLNQFNMVVSLDGDGVDLAQVHFYPYNPAVLAALPGPLRSAVGRGVTAAILRRLTVGLGYLPSWASPRLQVTARPAVEEGGLPELTVAREHPADPPSMLRTVLARMARVAPHLDLWPLVPEVTVAAGAKSYHFGGSFPHRTGPAGPVGDLTTDVLGRLPRWSRVHLVDGSVFPTVPAPTFTLTVMANAHRIADAVMAPARWS